MSDLAKTLELAVLIIFFMGILVSCKNP